MNNGTMNREDIAYSILDVKYIKAMGRDVSIDPRANKDLYPAGWYSNGNISQKARILAEAIEKKCLITDTSSYAEFEEGIRRKIRRVNI